MISSLEVFLSTPSARRATIVPFRVYNEGTNFYPRPPRGGRPFCGRWILIHGRYFYPRPPRGGRQVNINAPDVDVNISIHALREEGDRFSGRCPKRRRNFYPRPPRGGRPFPRRPILTASYDFYPRPPRGGRPGKGMVQQGSVEISIHALREEGDLSLGRARPRHRGDFYPRPPRGGRPLNYQRSRAPGVFLSTPSARRATAITRPSTRLASNFYPRPPRGGRPAQQVSRALR